MIGFSTPWEGKDPQVLTCGLVHTELLGDSFSQRTPVLATELQVRNVGVTKYRRVASHEDFGAWPGKRMEVGDLKPTGAEVQLSGLHV